MSEKLVVRDQRTENRYFVDNILIDTYGPLLGPYGIAAYNVILRHSNPRGFGAFPSYATVARKTGMGIGTVKGRIQQLVKLGLIEVYPRYRSNGAQTSNGFVVLDPPPEPIKDECPWIGGIVYAVAYDGLCKIGSTKKLDARLAALENELGEKPELLASMEVDARWEKEAELHKKYRKHREHGEWFSLNAAQIEEVMKALTPGGLDDLGVGGLGDQGPGGLGDHDQSTDDESSPINPKPMPQAAKGPIPEPSIPLPDIEGPWKGPAPPAAKVYLERFNFNARKTLWRRIHETVGDQLDDLEFWDAVIAKYDALGWNPKNIDGMLEWYEKRELPAVTRRGGNGKGEQNKRIIDGWMSGWQTSEPAIEAEYTITGEVL